MIVAPSLVFFFFFNDTATTEIYTLSLHDALPIFAGLTLGVIVQAIVGLIQYFTRSHMGLEMLGETGTMAIRMLESSSVQGASVFRVGAFLSHPNVFGIFLACLLPIAIGGFLLRIGKGYKLFFL